MNENLIAFKDSENKEKLYDSSRNINYHGVTLVASPSATADNGFALYEPAYGIRIMDEPGKGFFRFNDNAEKKDTEKAVANFLDKESSKLESCQEEGNYLGQVAFDIIANNREVKNKEHNKPFQEKIENLRKNVMEKLKKGVAITVAFAACACFAPKLSAEQGNFSIEQTAIEQGTLYDTTVGEPKQQAVKDTVEILNIIEQAKADGKITNDEMNVMNSRIKAFNDSYGKASFNAVSEGLQEAKKEVKDAFGKDVKLQEVAETGVRKAANTQKNVKAMHRSLEDLYSGR